MSLLDDCRQFSIGDRKIVETVQMRLDLLEGLTEYRDRKERVETDVRSERAVLGRNGESALEFVRSRHGVGSEGSDFARSRRQQLVISALKDKAFSLGVILNPVKLIGVYNILKANINTNIDVEKIDDFIKLARKLQDGEIKNYVIDQGNEADKRFGLLKNPPITEEYRLKWVLIPRTGNGDFSEIHDYIDCHIQNRQCEVAKNGILVILTPTPPPQRISPK